MVYSSNEKRGFQPPQNEKEKHFVRRIEELYLLSQKRGISRYSCFLTSREQALAQMVLNRYNSQEYSFEGGYSEAERKILCLEPADIFDEPPICCVRVELLNREIAQHRDYLGAVLGLGLERDCLGDILIDADNPSVAYLFVLKHVSSLLCDELTSIGRYAAITKLFYGNVPYKEPERVIKTATVSSLRADAVIAAMLQCSRSQAVDLLRAGKVEVNHVSLSNSHASIYEDDLITIRGKGRYRLKSLGGKSRKDRLFIQFFQY